MRRPVWHLLRGERVWDGLVGARPRCAAGAGGRGAPDYGCRPRRVRTQPRRNQDGRGAPEPRLSQARAQLPRAARKRPLTRAANSAPARPNRLPPNDRGGGETLGPGSGSPPMRTGCLPAHSRAVANHRPNQLRGVTGLPAGGPWGGSATARTPRSRSGSPGASETACVRRPGQEEGRVMKLSAQTLVMTSARHPRRAIEPKEPEIQANAGRSPRARTRCRSAPLAGACAVVRRLFDDAPRRHDHARGAAPDRSRPRLPARPNPGEQ